MLRISCLWNLSLLPAKIDHRRKREWEAACFLVAACVKLCYSTRQNSCYRRIIAKCSSPVTIIEFPNIYPACCTKTDVSVHGNFKVSLTPNSLADKYRLKPPLERARRSIRIVQNQCDAESSGTGVGRLLTVSKCDINELRSHFPPGVR